ncbi:MAG: 2-hydroxyglutaryl-CoA dehydratase, partial [Firmicutes bacterium]|nr:2-hydroxyglutaryl-CoA dehydratase [Bacillota bacterium]
MRIGIDIGSTTVKVLVLTDQNHICFSRYERHMSNVFEKVKELLEELDQQYPGLTGNICITGSGGLTLSQLIGIPFEQEVITCSKAVETFIPSTNVAIELGGEDAKITFYGAMVEQRMNGTCAGGTGAFIDQMAVLLNTDANGLNEAAASHTMIYPIAARCGVFAKSDIQPLINEGAKKEDLAASIFQAVVNQTISGLACGRTIKGNVAFLGGPLSFMPELRKRFIETLELTPEQVIFPSDSQYNVAMGAALMAEKYPKQSIEDILDRLNNTSAADMSETKHSEPLFKNQEEYDAFCERHAKHKIRRRDIREAKGP